MKKHRLAVLASVLFMLIITGSCRKTVYQASDPVATTPQIITFFPKTGAADTVVTIACINFSEDKNSLTVKFGSTVATEIVSVTANQVIVKVPKQAKSGPVKLSVTVAGQEAIAAQDFVVEQTTWNKLYGSSGYDDPAALVRAADGGYIAVGETTNNTKGSSDVWIIKTDAEGNMVWQKTYGGSDYEQGRGVALAADGSILIVATTASNNTGNVGINHGAEDIWVLKLDASGNLVWQKTFGGTYNDYATGITATSDGNFVFTGTTSSNNTGDVGANHGNDDYWVVKINAAGTILWQQTFGGTGSDLAASVISQADGSIAVAGATGSNNTGDVGPTKGVNDIWVIKLNAAGNLIWKKTYGGNGYEAANAITGIADGGFAVAGSTNSVNNGDVGPNQGGRDMWILKLGADGSLQWQKTLGGDDDDYGYAVCTGPNGSLVVAGTTASNDYGDVGPAHGRDDIWLVKLSSTGDVLGKMVKGGTYDDESVAVIQYPGQGYVIAGYTRSNKTGDVGASNGDWDAWLFKINEF